MLLFSSLRSFVSQPEQQKKGASEGLKKSSFTEVYAPPLVGCSDAYIIFANERGLMIYGRNQEKLLAALDLQALDCNYFNADTVMTHIMMEDDMLYMYNEMCIRDRVQPVNDKNIEAVLPFPSHAKTCCPWIPPVDSKKKIFSSSDKAESSMVASTI